MHSLLGPYRDRLTLHSFCTLSCYWRLFARYLRPQRARMGLETLVGTGSVKLSSSQVQHTAARMFVRGAELLALSDEMRRLWASETSETMTTSEGVAET